MAANSVTQSDSVANKKIMKPSEHSPLKVDAIVAMVMGVGAAKASDTEPAWDGRVSFI
jgi:phage terminase large subunit-like protein